MKSEKFPIRCELCRKHLGFAWFKEGTTRDTICISVAGKSIRICEDCYDEYTAKAIQVISNMRSSHNPEKHVSSNTRKKQRNPRKAAA